MAGWRANRTDLNYVLLY